MKFVKIPSLHWQVADVYEDLSIQQDDDLAGEVAILASLKLQHLLHKVSSTYLILS